MLSSQVTFFNVTSHANTLCCTLFAVVNIIFIFTIFVDFFDRTLHCFISYFFTEKQILTLQNTSLSYYTFDMKPNLFDGEFDKIKKLAFRVHNYKKYYPCNLLFISTVRLRKITGIPFTRIFTFILNIYTFIFNIIICITLLEFNDPFSSYYSECGDLTFDWFWEDLWIYCTYAFDSIVDSTTLFNNPTSVYEYKFMDFKIRNSLVLTIWVILLTCFLYKFIYFY